MGYEDEITPLGLRPLKSTQTLVKTAYITNIIMYLLLQLTT